MLVTGARGHAAGSVGAEKLSLGSERFVAPRFVDTHDRDAQLERLVAIGVVDVRIHLERLDRCIERRDSDAVYGALLDLFIATDERSTEVRRRAMHWAGMLLPAAQREFLSWHLATGLDARQAMIPSRFSRSSLGVVGATRLVAAVRE